MIGLWEVCVSTYGVDPRIIGVVSGQWKGQAEEQAALVFAAEYRDPDNILFVRLLPIVEEILPKPKPPPLPNVWERLRIWEV